MERESERERETVLFWIRFFFVLAIGEDASGDERVEESEFETEFKEREKEFLFSVF